LKVQDTKEDSSGELEVLVKWLQLSDWEHSWNAATSIQEAIFGFQLEDKICQKKKKLEDKMIHSLSGGHW
jgi:hypothetical protein